MIVLWLLSVIIGLCFLSALFAFVLPMLFAFMQQLGPVLFLVFLVLLSLKLLHIML